MNGRATHTSGCNAVEFDGMFLTGSFHAASAAFNNTSIPCDSTGLLKQ